MLHNPILSLELKVDNHIWPPIKSFKSHIW